MISTYRARSVRLVLLLALVPGLLCALQTHSPVVGAEAHAAAGDRRAAVRVPEWPQGTAYVVRGTRSVAQSRVLSSAPGARPYVVLRARGDSPTKKQWKRWLSRDTYRWREYWAAGLQVGTDKVGTWSYKLKIPAYRGSPGSTTKPFVVNVYEPQERPRALTQAHEDWWTYRIGDDRQTSLVAFEASGPLQQRRAYALRGIDGEVLDDSVRSIELSPAGRLLLWTRATNFGPPGDNVFTLYSYDPGTDERLALISAKAKATDGAFRFSEDGQLVVFELKKTLVAADLTTGEVTTLLTGCERFRGYDVVPGTSTVVVSIYRGCQRAGAGVHLVDTVTGEIEAISATGAGGPGTSPYVSGALDGEHVLTRVVDFEDPRFWTLDLIDRTWQRGPADTEFRSANLRFAAYYVIKSRPRSLMAEVRSRDTVTGETVGSWSVRYPDQFCCGQDFALSVSADGEQVSMSSPSGWDSFSTLTHVLGPGDRVRLVRNVPSLVLLGRDRYAGVVGDTLRFADLP
ncbi:MAG: hypothetical protein KKE65_00335 [Actinobacteria bacterium]|nr:hypothetical protein [Actinomycetota bacterium]MBU2110081.1 hypothetical protein [Actinomycetota bacterium]